MLTMSALMAQVAFGLNTTVCVAYKFRNCKYKRFNIIVVNK